jgi:hypothetical protein
MLSTGRENQVRELLIQLLKPIAEGFSSPITAHLAPFLMTSFISFWNMVKEHRARSDFCTGIKK